MNEPSLIVRASSWGALFDCAMRWEGIHMLGIRNHVGIRAALGTSIHAGTAAFDQGRIDLDGTTADSAVGVFLDKLHDPENEFDQRRDDLSMKNAEKIGAVLVSRYCSEISPRYDFEAVEMTAKPLDIDCGGGIVVRLTGTLDRSRIRRTSGGIGISDIKSGSTAVQDGVAKTKGHAAQLGTYELLYEHSTGNSITEPGEIIGLKTSAKPEIGTGIINNARQIMTGTEQQHGLIEFAAEMFRVGLFPPNPSSRLCSEKYCPRFSTCHFK